MKHKVAELGGGPLDYAVAIAEGVALAHQVPLPYSSDWAHGDPIIKRESIDVIPWADSWAACVGSKVERLDRPISLGPTLLNAAMRAYVASKLGDEIELP